MSDGAQLLEALVAYVRCYVVLTPAQADAVALWVAHTHAVSAAETTPYLLVTSAEKRSGKSRLLEVLELVVHKPLPTSNISDAALFRAIAELGPTLLLDEVDAIFGKAREREDLRGLLNAGYRRGAVALRMGGPRMTTLETFPVFCPKVFAAIGQLPDTIADRSIPIRLERKTRDEKIERFRRRDAEGVAEPLFQSAMSWGDHHAALLAGARPDLPEELDDRAWDFWEPLLAIADLAGDGWLERARAAAVQLSGPKARSEDDSLTAALLRDIFSIFESNGTEHYKTADLIAELVKVEESPWGDYRGKPITSHGLSRLLKPHSIKTMAVWVDGETVRGYKREQFADAFHRVLGVRGDRSVRPGSQGQNGLTGPNPPNAPNAFENQGVGSEVASEAAPSASNAPNAAGAGEGGNGRPPLPGDSDFPDLVDLHLHEGRLTESEWLERRQLHALIRAAELEDKDG